MNIIPLNEEFSVQKFDFSTSPIAKHICKFLTKIILLWIFCKQKLCNWLKVVIPLSWRGVQQGCPASKSIWRNRNDMGNFYIGKMRDFYKDTVNILVPYLSLLGWSIKNQTQRLIFKTKSFPIYFVSRGVTETIICFYTLMST